MRDEKDGKNITTYVDTKKRTQHSHVKKMNEMKKILWLTSIPKNALSTAM